MTVRTISDLTQAVRQVVDTIGADYEILAGTIGVDVVRATSNDNYEIRLSYDYSYCVVSLLSRV